MADVTMPKLSDTMEEGKILRWLKQQGDRVEVGDLLVEVETDKADMEVEASVAGVLREVKLGEGDTAPVGAVIAVIEDGGAAAGDGKSASARAADSAKPEPKPAAPPPRAATDRAEAPRGKESPRATGDAGAGPRAEAEERQSRPQPRTEPGGARPQAQQRPAAAPAPARRGQEVKASPLARSLADKLGVDLTTVRGTGPAGRITQRDVEEAHARGAGGAEQAPAARPAARSESAEDLDATPQPEPEHGGTPPGAAAASEAATSEEASPAKPRSDERPREERAARTADGAPQRTTAAGGVRREPLSRMRASIAKRMAESMREAPHFYLTTVVDMDEAVRLRAQLKALEASPVSVTYNHMVLKAVAGALVRFPEVNARFAGDAIEILEDVNLGIATAVDDGLIVPVLSHADRLSLLEIAQQARALAEKAESGRFSSADLSGATFSVSNLGMYDVDSFSAVINPPQAAILAVGSVKQRPVVRDGALAVGYTMALTLSCDHRVIDGARGGRFLAEVKRRLENPASLLLPEAG